MEQLEGMSLDGFEKLAETNKEIRMGMSKQMKYDLVGVLYSLPDYLEIDSRSESREQVDIFNNLDDFLNTGNYPYELRDRVTELANNYGIAAEETGFRRGFHTAMRLCMEGMSAKA